MKKGVKRVEEPPEPSLTFALEPIGSSGDMTNKLGLLLTNALSKTAEASAAGMHTLSGAHPRGK